MSYISAASLCVALPTLGDKNATTKILWSELLAAQDRENTSHQEYGLCEYVCVDVRSSVTDNISGMVESLHIEVDQSGVATNFLATRRVILSTRIECAALFVDQNKTFHWMLALPAAGTGVKAMHLYAINSDLE
ncbi:predicted protein [Postia placenta Mad-698-R]|uniref:Uncharacterized protein n=1 Tax=Postia placenta MAD-698-R-SB12 TaxID=670580 RepID=A0A1X6NB45_9APHY|nr:hypothetical protein POSPLADRAFT_1132103 [Postia placenta MAD-698-R-SB12]EED79909.1 predicted protein [Postia placenta Mad-698-R]OSX65821.1 hypothetical protein POSPLADRAFT_1132103 [Postia placenta MAD-698-R-SB12]